MDTKKTVEVEAKLIVTLISLLVIITGVALYLGFLNQNIDYCVYKDDIVVMQDYNDSFEQNNSELQQYEDNISVVEDNIDFILETDNNINLSIQE